MISQTADAGRGQNKAPVCSECGTPQSPGQSFCEGCGAVLSWTPGTGHPPETADSAETPAYGVALIDPADDITTVRADGVAAGAQHVPTVPEPAYPANAFRGGTGAWSGTPGPDAAFTVPTPATAPGVPTTESHPADAWESSAEDRARALLIPVADPGPAAQPSVAPVLPGVPISARPKVQGFQEQSDEDGARCPWCGTGNRPDRHFCRRCAMSMAGRPADAARRPWWHRLPGLGDRRVLWAGDRPRLRRGLGRVLSWVAGAAALALLVTAALHTGTAVQAVRDHFAKRAPVAPDAFRASHSYTAHGPKLAFDKLNNTWWGPGRTQSATGEWVEARFSQPADLLDVVITSGESTVPTDLAKSALPRTVEAVVTTADGKTRNRVLTLDGASGGQRRTFRVSDVTSVRLVLNSAYGASAKKQVAIAEIEFFGRSSSGS